MSVFLSYKNLYYFMLIFIMRTDFCSIRIIKSSLKPKKRIDYSDSDAHLLVDCIIPSEHPDRPGRP